MRLWFGVKCECVTELIIRAYDELRRLCLSSRMGNEYKREVQWGHRAIVPS